MNREIHQWFSPHLRKNMEIVAYGHFGPAILLFPTAAADYLEYERFHLIDAVKPHIEAGKVKVYSINSINSESWLNSKMHPYDKRVRHQQFNRYVYDEVVPFIHSHCRGKVPIINAGASFGALHAANMLFQRPDLFDGVIAMSGIYDLTYYTNGYWDEGVYFNSPMHYLPNANDEAYLAQLRAKKHIYFVTGKGPYEAPHHSWQIGQVCGQKGIPNWVDMWGTEWRHDWPTWRAMLPHYIATRL